jgi:hypothetical protein
LVFTFKKERPLEQEDFIKRQIDQLGQALGKILSDLLGLISCGNMPIVIDETGQALKTALGLDIDDLISVPADTFIKALSDVMKESDANFDKLAGILFILAEEIKTSVSGIGKEKKLYERSLIIYEHLDNSSSTYSFERHSRILKIKSELS